MKHCAICGCPGDYHYERTASGRTGCSVCTLTDTRNLWCSAFVPRHGTSWVPDVDAVPVFTDAVRETIAGLNKVLFSGDYHMTDETHRELDGYREDLLTALREFVVMEKPS